jgi:flavin reductase (DIM6/NTAB) family NADH-FMN oxidoreductase RutF
MDSANKKTALRMISHGLYLLTVQGQGRYNASTVSWLSQASFEPPLVMVGVRVDTQTHTILEESRQFAINVLALGQTELAQTFFKHAEYEEGAGAPLFLDAPAWFECKVVDMVKGGDHTVVVAEVVEAGVHNSDITPMALRDTSWHYGG